MSSPSVQLNESAVATSDANGNVTLTFSLPKVNRIWQGTVSVINSSAGSAWTVSIGGFVLGTLYAPGPFGPVQLLPGQQLALSIDGLEADTQYNAVLLGVNDPSDNPTPYTGPTAVTSISLGAP